MCDLCGSWVAGPQKIKTNNNTLLFQCGDRIKKKTNNKYNLSSTYKIICTYMILVLAIWYWVIKWCVLPLGRLLYLRINNIHVSQRWFILQLNIVQVNKVFNTLRCLLFSVLVIETRIHPVRKKMTLGDTLREVWVSSGGKVYPTSRANFSIRLNNTLTITIIFYIIVKKLYAVNH